MEIYTKYQFSALSYMQHRNLVPDKNKVKRGTFYSLGFSSKEVSSEQQDRKTEPSGTFGDFYTVEWIGLQLENNE